MRVSFHTEALQPMIDWLMAYKRTGERDRGRLEEILGMPDYQVELQRYGMPGLPVCGIGYDEAVDFFMNFDRRKFENPRLAHKKAPFLQFYEELEKRTETLSLFTELSPADQETIEALLANGLPAHVVNDIEELSIILIVSIGNSMGWPYEHYVDYDAANMNLFETKEDFLHVTAHEIHHILMGGLLGQEGITGEGFFLQNFAFEGLAVHFNNNQATLMKPARYPGQTYMMQQEDMAFYEAHFDEIFAMIRADFEASRAMTPEEAAGLVAEHYEQFSFLGKPVQQYPTYYFGCYLWGLLDLAYGKERMFEALEDPSLFVGLYNGAAKEAYRL